MDEKSRDRDLDLNIPMVPEMELTVTKVAEGVGEFMKLDIDKIEEIKMALIEACINAIEHSKSEDRRIAITFDIGEEELKIQIADSKFESSDSKFESARFRTRHRSDPDHANSDILLT